MSVDLGKQVFSNAQALNVSAALLLAFAVIPGLPVLPFLTLGIITGGLAFLTKRDNFRNQQAEEAQAQLQLQQEIEEEPENDQVTTSYRFIGPGTWLRVNPTG